MRRLRQWRGKLDARAGARHVALALAMVTCTSTFRDVPRDAATEIREYLGTPTRAPSGNEAVDSAPTRIWRLSVGRGTVGSPASGERITTLTTIDRWVYAFETRTGQLLWRYRGDGVYGTGPLMSGGQVFVASEGREGRLTAVDLFTGRRRWGTRVGDVAGPIALADSSIYGVTQAGVAFAVQAAAGRRRWSAPAVPSRAGVLVAGGRVLVAGLNDTLAILDAATGRRTARVGLPAAVLAPLAVADDSTVVMSSPAGMVAAIVVPSGRILWQVRTSAPVAGSPAVRRDTVFAMTTGCTLFVIPVTSPARADSTSMDCVTATGPTLVRDGVLVATVRGEIFFYDRARRRRGWTLRPGGEVRHPPIVRNGQILVGTLHGQAVSFR